MVNFKNYFNFIVITPKNVSFAKCTYIVTYSHLYGARKSGTKNKTLERNKAFFCMFVYKISSN